MQEYEAALQGGRQSLHGKRDAAPILRALKANG
jgi:hypothetical protein